MLLDIRFDEPLDSYHADSSCYGSSMLRTLRESPLLFHDTYITRTIPQTESPALSLGTLWHSAREAGGVAELLKKAIMIGPEHLTPSGAVSTKKETREFLSQAQKDRMIVISRSQSEQLWAMETRFQQNSRAVSLEKDCEHREASIRFKRGHVSLRCRPDMISGRRIVDYKTTSDPRPDRTFKYSVDKYGYDIAAVLYQDGCEIAGIASDSMIFVVTSTVPPYHTIVAKMSEEFSRTARNEYVMLVDELADRLERGDWLPRGYDDLVSLETRGGAGQ